jgi:hypothetical protein
VRTAGLEPAQPCVREPYADKRSYRRPPPCRRSRSLCRLDNARGGLSSCGQQQTQFWTREKEGVGGSELRRDPRQPLVQFRVLGDQRNDPLDQRQDERVAPLSRNLRSGLKDPHHSQLKCDRTRRYTVHSFASRLNTTIRARAPRNPKSLAAAGATLECSGSFSPSLRCDSTASK